MDLALNTKGPREFYQSVIAATRDVAGSLRV